MRGLDGWMEMGGRWFWWRELEGGNRFLAWLISDWQRTCHATPSSCADSELPFLVSSAHELEVRVVDQTVGMGSLLYTTLCHIWVLRLDGGFCMFFFFLGRNLFCGDRGSVSWFVERVFFLVVFPCCYCYDIKIEKGKIRLGSDVCWIAFGADVGPEPFFFFSFFFSPSWLDWTMALYVWFVWER